MTGSSPPRVWQDRMDTLDHVRDAGINVCCGGIMGMGESRSERVGFIHAVACLPQHPLQPASTRAG